MAYNTGNPLGSTDPRDLVDNAGNLDEAVNSTDSTWTDRLGNERLTMAGMSSAAGDATVAINAAQTAVAAAARSETAAALASAGGAIYATAEDGQDATELPESAYFWVVSAADSAVLELWRKGAIDPTDTGRRLYDVSGFLTQIDKPNLDVLGRVASKLGVEFLRFTSDGKTEGDIVGAQGLALLAATEGDILEGSKDRVVTPDGLATVVSGAYRRNLDVAFRIDAGGVALIETDYEGNLYVVGVNIPELVDARGSSDTLDDRLSAYLDGTGQPLSEMIGEHTLSETRRKLADVVSGLDTVRYRIAINGDSWTDNNRDYYLKFLVPLIEGEFGFAGEGYFDFYRGSAHRPRDPDTGVIAGLTRTGFASTLGSASVGITGPAITQISASSVAASVTLTLNAVGTPDTIRLFARRSADGEIRYRYGAGAWTTISLVGSGNAIVTLDTPTDNTLTIERVTGTTTICGLDLYDSAATGVILDKLGAGGSRTSWWLLADEADWTEQIAALAPDCWVSFFGTNDMFSISADVFRSEQQQLIDRVKSVLPAADVLCVTPPDNILYAFPRSASQAQNAAAHRALAVANRWAHLDLQYAFGATVDDYTDKPSTSTPAGQARGYILDSNPNHPSTTGAALIARVFTQKILGA